MPRSIRIEYDGAVYHVMCRGDHYGAIFKDDEDRKTFLLTLGQACERAGWVIHSYVLMSNHYHLLLETPCGGLVDGMRWFQTTYTARYNSRHHQCGHLFQGRYKAILLDSSEPRYFRTVSEYIHLNPARAMLLDKQNPQLGMYPWSSYPAIIGKIKSPSWLYSQRVLDGQGPAGMTQREYQAYMDERVHFVLHNKDESDGEWKEIRKGWFLGDKSFREKLMERIGETIRNNKRESYSGEGRKAHDEREAERLLNKALVTLGVSLDDVVGWKTTDMRKQAIVWLIRSSTVVKSDWLCQRLGMKHRSNVSRAVRNMEDNNQPAIKQIKRKMRQCKDCDNASDPRPAPECPPP
jgi:putative transposase